MNKNIDLLKKKQRNIAIKKRSKISNLINLDNNLYYKKIIEFEWFKKTKIIASFLSIKTEISTTNINNFIIKSEKILSLPTINESKNGILDFKIYSNKDKLIMGKFGIMEPLNTKVVLPDVILIPCLAFDEDGYRLGYGGGYYDKSISYLKSINHKFITIGFAYEEQKIDKVLHDSYDQKLNYILTEKRLYKIL